MERKVALPLLYESTEKGLSYRGCKNAEFLQQFVVLYIRVSEESLALAGIWCELRLLNVVLCEDLYVSDWEAWE